MERQSLELITKEICEIFDVYAPPIPIEIMLQKPPAAMWEELDVSQLTSSFLSIRDRYSPRMSLARLLVRHIAASEWGEAHGLKDILGDTETLNSFARMLLMPQEMVLGITVSLQNPQAMSLHFEVPEDEARTRLLELL
jgi:hypothetical protein